MERIWGKTSKQAALALNSSGKLSLVSQAKVVLNFWVVEMFTKRNRDFNVH